MKSSEIRQKFFDFFESKGHLIVPSAPMVIKNDPTLMFTNAGMNQFKEYFLGNAKAQMQRIANSQKCLRVSGKHNDLEEVGLDTYHHTMFEMLGNWSFGDAARPEGGYFKKEAIEWAWELLTEVYKIDKERLYATYFGGDASDNLEPDEEALTFWKKLLPLSRILPGNKKDNFWEMGDTGPCGPCSEIHIDLRNNEERKKIPGEKLVNNGHPEVIEIWNLVFIQFNRQVNGRLVLLPDKHVDTGMGFERLCMSLQNVKSNYDTDVFQPIIQKIAKISSVKYGISAQTDIAMRVIADHVRAISFSIADGQLPSNNKAGYVIRRILRRAVRYGYTFLNLREPFIYKLVDVLAENMGNVFNELITQKQLIEKVIKEEESSFLRTLEIGIKLINQVIEKAKTENKTLIDGETAFELYDTYGFPYDLTELIARENNMGVDADIFNSELNKQKERSRQAGNIETADWIVLSDETNTVFTGYESLEEVITITRYRKVKAKDKDQYQLVFNKTPFYAESGGQVGDKGLLFDGERKIEIINTLKENNLWLHISTEIPQDLERKFRVLVYPDRRKTMKNHTATHLLHQALRNILGSHVEQKGSLVEPERLRFDFSHFQKLSVQEIRQIEKFVIERIIENHPLQENKNATMEEALAQGAIALFGEKYGKTVRTVQFGNSIELCGGTHVSATGEIGLFKIITESAVAAGIRRIEAVTGIKAFELVQEQDAMLTELSEILSSSKQGLLKTATNLVNQNKLLQKEVEASKAEKIVSLRKTLIEKSEQHGEYKLICTQLAMESADMVKDLMFEINRHADNIITLIGTVFHDKVNLWLMFSQNLVDEKKLNAVDIIRIIGKEIQGGGGGQAFFATAGGKNPAGLTAALKMGREIILSKL